MSINHFIAKIETRFNCFHERLHPFQEGQCLRTAHRADLRPTAEEVDLFQKWNAEVSSFLTQAGTADPSLSLLLIMSILRNKPNAVIETGVWHGVSSFFALKALDYNKNGHLISFDLPPFRSQYRVKIGAAVPEYLRSRWTLLLGPSISLLKAINSKVDMFVHDSEHTYRNMLSEFRVGWNILRSNGLLISDDIHSNAAFSDFQPSDCCEKLIHPRDKGGYIGSMRKAKA